MQTLYYNGEIITMEHEGDAPEAVLVEDGQIAAVGRLAELELRVKEGVARVDLEGRCLMPSFIDAHSHITMNAQMALCADLSPCTSFQDIVIAMKRYVAASGIGSGGVAVGFGYDHNFLNEQRHPDRTILDEVSKDIPIILIHVSGHLACANSAALRLAGITAETPDPQGGVIGRVGSTQKPNGYLEEAGMVQLQVAMAQRVKLDSKMMAQEMQEAYIKNGVTTVQDGASTERDIQFLRTVAENGLLKVDVVAYLMLSAGGHQIFSKNEDIDGKYKGRLKLGGYKLILDGSPQGRSAWLSDPYLGGKEGYCGYPWMADAQVEGACCQAVGDGKQLLAHCNGDAASEQFLTSYEKALRQLGDGGAELRPVMIHCQTVRNDQLDRMVGLGMIASVFVGHVYYWGDVHVRNLGEVRGNHISPVRDAMGRGIVVNFHQDTPVTKPNMLHSVWCAVNRVSRNGSIIGGDQAVSVYEALQAVTINAAYQYFEENEKGSIQAGKRADLVILDKSPLAVDKMKIKDIKVLQTIKDGAVIYNCL